jgi:hypothetical protein
MPTYAAKTEVTSSRSREEIEHTLERYGATSFAYGNEPGRAMIGFVKDDRTVRFVLPLPDRNDQRFTHHSRGLRTETAARAEYEQAVRQKWRALALMVKAKLEAVESGIVTFEQEFLAHTVLPSGRTVFEETGHAVTESISTGKVQPLLQLEGGRS